MKLVSASFGFQLGEKPIEMYKKDVQEVAHGLGTTATESNLWLPYASQHYKISPNIEDYILVPVPGIYNDLPNTNGDCVALRELLAFKPDLGMQAFKTFRGKPCYKEHDNQKIERAKGVILDCYIRPIKRYGNGKHYKIVMLHAFDRTKDPLLASRILSGQENAYSVGFYYTHYTCTECGRRIGAKDQPCEHTSRDPRHPLRRPYIKNGRLVYRMCHDITGFESSSVADPAFICASGDPLR